MRFFDFLIFYTTQFFKNQKGRFTIFPDPLDSAVWLGGLGIAALIFSCLEFMVYFIAKINLLEIHNIKIWAIISGLLVIQLISYIYVRKKRYEYINSPDYKTFTLSAKLGGRISVIILVLSYFLIIASGLIVSKMLR